MGHGVIHVVYWLCSCSDHLRGAGCACEICQIQKEKHEDVSWFLKLNRSVLASILILDNRK